MRGPLGFVYHTRSHSIERKSSTFLFLLTVIFLIDVRVSLHMRPTGSRLWDIFFSASCFTEISSGSEFSYSSPLVFFGVKQKDVKSTCLQFNMKRFRPIRFSKSFWPTCVSYLQHILSMNMFLILMTPRKLGGIHYFPSFTRIRIYQTGFQHALYKLEAGSFNHF